MNNTELIKNVYETYKNDPKQLGFQSVFTPVDTLANYFNFKKEIENKTNIGILFNVEFLEYFFRDFNDIKDKKFTFFYDSQVDLCMAWGLVNNGNVDFVSVEEFSNKNIETLKDKIMPKHFDVVFTNPPYNRKIDLTIINSIIKNDIADRIVAVHPASFLFVKDLMKNKKEMKKWLKSANIFWGNEMFNIQLFVPLCISVWDKDNKSETIHIVDNGYSNEEYDIDYDNLHYYGKKNVEMLNFKKHVEEYMKEHDGSILDHNIKAGYNGMTKYSVRFAQFVGSIPTNNKPYKVNDNFWTITNKNSQSNKCDETFRYEDSLNNHPTLCKEMTLWSFKNEIEQENFIDYCKTKVIRFLITFTKPHANIISSRCTDIIPWMDWNKTWTDEELVKEFEISEDLWNYIDKFIPDYYEDYRSAVRGNI